MKPSDTSLSLMPSAPSAIYGRADRDLNLLWQGVDQGLKLEKMGDILHDFKNPAIAVAGFAKRLQKILEEGVYPKNEKVDQALDILLKETSRIQELALTLHEKGKESVIDLTEISKRRFLINKETLKELKRGNVQLIERTLSLLYGFDATPSS